MPDQETIDGLLAERAGYARRGLPDRVAQVDEQLRARGHAVPVDRKPAPRTTTTARQRRTTSEES